MLTLIKRCKRHGIRLGDNAASLQPAFEAAFPEARFDAESQEWVTSWRTGKFAPSHAVLAAFFASCGETVTDIDKC